jgi:hypothetical protein
MPLASRPTPPCRSFPTTEGTASPDNQAPVPRVPVPSTDRHIPSLNILNVAPNIQRRATPATASALPSVSEADHSPAPGIRGSNADSATPETTASNSDASDQDALISLKRLYRRGSNTVFSGGVNDVTWKLRERNRLRSHVLAIATRRESPDAKTNHMWFNAETGQVLRGKFIFATMGDGEIRLGAPENGKNGHVSLTGGADGIRFAGEVTFGTQGSDEGKVIEFSNRSGSYLPIATQRFQSGFGVSGVYVEFDKVDIQLDMKERIATLGTLLKSPVDPPMPTAELKNAASGVVKSIVDLFAAAETTAPSPARCGLLSDPESNSLAPSP